MSRFFFWLMCSIIDTITIISQDYRACPLFQYAWTKPLNCHLNRLYAPSVTASFSPREVSAVRLCKKLITTECGLPLILSFSQTGYCQEILIFVNHDACNFDRSLLPILMPLFRRFVADSDESGLDRMPDASAPSTFLLSLRSFSAQ